MAVRAQFGSHGYYGGHSGWNPRGELVFMGKTETMAYSGVREGDLVTTPSLPTRTYIDSKVGGARGVPGINTTTPNQDRQRHWGGRVGGAQGGPGKKTKPPHQDGQRHRGGGQQSRSCARGDKPDIQAHRSGTGCGVVRVCHVGGRQEGTNIGGGGRSA